MIKEGQASRAAVERLADTLAAYFAPFVVFVVLNGAGNGGFFSTVPSVVGHVYGSQRVANALAMLVSGWAFGYLLVSPRPLAMPGACD